MRTYTNLTGMALRLYLREPMAAFFTMAFPSLLLVLFGSIYGNTPTPMFGGRGTIDISMPNYTGLILATVALMNIPITTSSYRELGILRRFRATPMRPLTYIAADVSTNLLMTIVGMVVLLAMGCVLYRVNFEGQLISFLAAVVLSCLAMFSLGYLIAGLAAGARMAQVAGMLILYPMMFLSGAGFPIELLPDSVRRISDFLPLTYAVNLLRGMWFGEAWSAHLLDVAVLGIMIVVLGGLAVRFFRWE
ncbi:MAG: ABC transporter permease [Anaerolineales bacterium]|nr:ABC transporter permease [Anaerolineales bacterium]